MAFRQIKSGALANQAVLNTKLDTSTIDQQASLSGVDGLDTFLVFDNDTQALKKVSSSGLIGSYTTDDISEGTESNSNLYFTDVRAKAAVAQDIADAVAAEATIRAAADTTLTTDLAAETAARAAADTALQTSLDTEVTRATNRENAMESAFQSADTAINTRIDNVLSNVDSEALNSLAEIVTAFQDADDALSASIITNASAISNEVSRATTKESTIEANLASETTARQGADTTLQTNLTNEIAARVSGDNALDARMTTSEGDITQLETDLAAEISTTDGEVTALQNSVSAEVTRATAAEEANAQGLAAEISARAIADNAVRSDLGADIVTGDNATLVSAQTHDDLLIGDNTVDGTGGNTVTARIATAKSGAESVAAADAAAKVLVEKTRAETAESGLQSQITSNDGEISTLQSEMDTVEGRATSLESRATTVEGRVDVIVGTSPETLDTLQEIVAAFEASDSDISALVSSNTIAISNEATARSSADTTLQSNIDTEASTRATADATLTSGLAQELVDRAAGDTAVQAAAAVDATSKADAAEASAKSHAESKDELFIGDVSVDGTGGNTITDRIATAKSTAETHADTIVAAETALRISGDTALSLRATNLEGRMDTAETDIDANTSDIATETTARVSADTTLQGNIDAEAVTRAAADTQHDADLLAEQTARIAADSATDASLAQEVTRATGVEAGLRTDVDTNTGSIATNAASINSEVARAIAAEGVLTTAVSDETAARIAADTAIQTDLDIVEGRVDFLVNAAPETLDTLVEIIGAYENADSDMQVVIDNNSSRLTANESSISTLNTEMDAVEARATTLESEMDAVEARATTLETEMDAAESEIDDLEAFVGEGTSLDTVANDLAGAVNELHTDTNAVAGRLTTAESSIVTNATTISTETARAQAEETSIRGDFAAADTSIRSDFAAADAVVLNSASSDATTKADNAEAAAKTYSDGIIATEASTREAADDLLEGQITAEATTRANADNALDTRATALESEMTLTQTSVGVATDGAYVSRTGSNFLDTAVSLKDESTKLDVALKAEETARIAADNTLTNNLNSEISSRTSGDASLQSQITAEVGRATSAEQANAANIATNATAISDEATRAQTAEAAVNARVDFIVSNTDPAALDSLTEIVTAFGDADSDLTSLISSNQTDIATNASGLAQEITDRIAAVTAEAASRTTADTTLQSNIDQKIAKSGDTMSGVLNMGSNKVAAVADGTVASDAVNKGQMDAGLAAQHISQFSTTDLAEGSNEYYLDSKARSAISINDVKGNGRVSYNSSTGVVSVDAAANLLELDDVSETTYVGKADYLMQVKADESGWDFIHPNDLQFIQPNRQVMDGDGVQTNFAITFYVNIADALVFVGGVIQDPGTHYSFDSVAQEIIFTAPIPNGAQAVIISHSVGAVQGVLDGSVSTSSFTADIKVGEQGAQQTVGTVEAAVSSFPKANHRSAKYLVSIESPDGQEFETRECLVVHNGTSAFITEYGVIFTGSTTLGDTDVRVNSGTGDIELTYTANAESTKVTVVATYIDA
jgi:predicted  nucleic acid-binding Zn-ribbon protein